MYLCLLMQTNYKNKGGIFVGMYMVDSITYN